MMDPLAPTGSQTGAPVVVVGAGITGASIAFHLADRGAHVTVVEQGLPARGATGASFAWIGRQAPDQRPSAQLRSIALDEYHRLETALPHLPVTWPGSLLWDHADLDEQGAARLAPDLSALEPNLELPVQIAQFRPEDGSLDPVAATERLLQEAERRGAEVRLGEPVIGLGRSGGGAIVGVQTPTGFVDASMVVLACGVGSVALGRGVGIDLPVQASPAVLVRLEAPPGSVRHILSSPELELRQLPDGQLLAPVEYTGERGSADLAATAAATQDRVNAVLGGGALARARSAVVGWRPMPLDGEPIIGSADGIGGLYVAVMHSAVTLAAAVGRLAADEILTGRPSPELNGCRLERFGQ